MVIPFAPSGVKLPNTPPTWPFGTTRPPTAAQMQRDMLKRIEPAPF